MTPQPDRAGTPGFNVFVVLLHASAGSGVMIVIDRAPILVGTGSAPLSTLIVSGMRYGVASGTHSGAGVPSGTASLRVPLNTNLICLPWYAQAIIFGDVTTDGVMDLDPMFTNAATGLVGPQ